MNTVRTVRREVVLKKTQEIRPPMGVLAAALAPHDGSLLAGCMDGVYRVSPDPADPEKLFAHDSYVSSVAWSADGQVLSAGYDGAVRWFDPDRRETVRRLPLHEFWSWDMAVSPDGRSLASVTGQYLAGGYRYEPQAEREPSVRIVSVETGDIMHSLPHVPSVQAVAWSPDSRHVAAGNLMGEVRVFDVRDGSLAASFTTPDFTSWGIIKSHCYLGGIFALQFTPDGNDLLLAGMGPMRDPMAGNGRQLWQRWRWNADTPEMLDQTHEGESGEGLMETLAVHPSGEFFVMGGRLRGGDWNVALFDLQTGSRIAALKTGCRVTQALFSADGSELVLAGTQGQPGKQQDGRFPAFGRIEVYEISRS